jgi:hypothetical protein
MNMLKTAKRTWNVGIWGLGRASGISRSRLGRPKTFSQYRRMVAKTG